MPYFRAILKSTYTREVIVQAANSSCVFFGDEDGGTEDDFEVVEEVSEDAGEQEANYITPLPDYQPKRSARRRK